jgi:hypothetical protein
VKPRTSGVHSWGHGLFRSCSGAGRGFFLLCGVWAVGDLLKAHVPLRPHAHEPLQIRLIGCLQLELRNGTSNVPVRTLAAWLPTVVIVTEKVPAMLVSTAVTVTDPAAARWPGQVPVCLAAGPISKGSDASPGAAWRPLALACSAEFAFRT